jgi:hypothetical protein
VDDPKGHDHNYDAIKTFFEGPIEYDRTAKNLLYEPEHFVDETIGLPLGQGKHKCYFINLGDPPLYDTEINGEYGDIVFDPENGQKCGDHLHDNWRKNFELRLRHMFGRHSLMMYQIMIILLLL